MKIKEYKWKPLPKINTEPLWPNLDNTRINRSKTQYYSDTIVPTSWEIIVFPIKNLWWTVKVYAYGNNQLSIWETNWENTFCLNWTLWWNGWITDDILVNARGNIWTFLWFTEAWLKMQFNTVSATWTTIKIIW